MKRRNFIGIGAAGSLAAAAAGTLPLLSSSNEMKMTKTNLKTPLCDLLKIEYPIIQAGMADIAGPELVAAVSNAGGMGILTATMVPPDLLRERIAQVRKLTNKPFGLNLILQKDLFPPGEYEISDETNRLVHQTLNVFRRELDMPESFAKPPKLPPLIQTAFDILLEERVPVFSVGLGNPSKEMIRLCHERNMKVMVMISSVEDAKQVESNGADVIVAQGSEAGGHRSTWEKKESAEYASIGTLPLTSAVSSVVKVPVVAAGGIVNGKGLKAALALGAQGVLMGTRFIATRESMAPASYKQKLLDSSSDNTLITDVFTGMYARVLRNRFTETYRKNQTPVFPPGRQFAATTEIVKTAGKKENPELCALYAGQGLDDIHDIKQAGEVIRDILKEFNG